PQLVGEGANLYRPFGEAAGRSLLCRLQPDVAVFGDELQLCADEFRVDLLACQWRTLAGTEIDDPHDRLPPCTGLLFLFRRNLLGSNAKVYLPLLDVLFKCFVAELDNAPRPVHGCSRYVELLSSLRNRNFLFSRGHIPGC